MGAILTTQEKIRDRFKQIKESRERIKSRKYSTCTFIDKDLWLGKLKKSSLSGDSPSSALHGFVDIDDGLTYYCPIEDFSKEELAHVRKIRGLG